MKKLLFLFIIFFTANIQTKGIVVFLKGSSCAGKTSLSREFVSRAQKWKVVESDALFSEGFVKLIKEIFPDEYKIITEAIDKKNLFWALKLRDILFEDSASEQHKIEAARAIDHIRKTLDDPKNRLWYENFKKDLVPFTKQKINELALQGYNVLADVWGLDADYYDFHRKQGALFVILYCPFNVIIQRFFARNNKTYETKDSQPKRLFYYTLPSFNSRYTITNDTNEVFDVLTRKQAITALEKVKKYLIQIDPPDTPLPVFSRREMNLPEFKVYEYYMLSRFTSETMYVAPRGPCDFFIRSDQHTPEECAQMLLDWVRGKIS